MSLLDSLGLDPEEFVWVDLASCAIPRDTDPREIETRSNVFFEIYEENVVMADQADQLCAHCPVAKQCLRWGKESKSWGVFGGMFLVNGKIDKASNSHKSPAVWKQMEDIHGRDAIRTS